jgi:hypothetical protein
MAILNGATVAIEAANGAVTELTGPIHAFKDAEGWWAGLITTDPAVPSKATLVGQRVQIKAAGVVASACVSDRVELRAATPTVQLLMRGEGPPPFLTNGKM